MRALKSRFLLPLFLIGLSLGLSGCYESLVEVVSEEQAVSPALIKNYKFYGYGREEGGEFSKSEPDVYDIVNTLGKNIYVAQTSDRGAGEREIRFQELEPNLYLMQVRSLVGSNPRYQLMLLRQEGGEYFMLMPERFNNQNIDVWRSQQAFAEQLNLRLEGQGYGPYRLIGEPDQIRIFMHSLTTLPMTKVYKFTATRP